MIGLALCVAGYIYILKAIQEELQIQHEINLKLPPDQQFEPTLWWFGTRARFGRLQRELIPESPRPRRLRKFQWIGFAALFAGMLVLITTWSASHK